MKAQRPYPQITITPKGEAALVGGHPWVYEGEVTGLSGPGVRRTAGGRHQPPGQLAGLRFFNSRSRIRVRVLSRNPNDRFDQAFWRRIQYAWDYRKTVMGPEDSRCCRVIFGEADGFPGLTVDRFESVLVAQVLCLGMELIKEELFSLLLEVLRSDGQDVVGVYERNDVAIRGLEGMEQGKGWHPVGGEKAPDFTAVDIEENGIRYTVDFETGKKPASFWIRSTTGRRWPSWPWPDGAGLLHPHRLFCPERRTGRSQARHGRWTCRSSPWRVPGKTPGATGFPT